MVTIYLDSNVVEAKTKRNRNEAEQLAVDQLWKWHRAGKVTLQTSQHSLREMKKHGVPQDHENHKPGLEGLGSVEEDQVVLGFHNGSDPLGGFTTYPLVSDLGDEVLYHDLIDLGLTCDDAKHLMYAVVNHCQWFLTYDQQVFLKRRRAKLEQRCPGIRIGTPSDLISELTPVISADLTETPSPATHVA